jgi:hypothetical protein
MGWPEPETVDAAVRAWAKRLVEAAPAVQSVGYFGSYARGEASVGSDADLVVITNAAIPPEQRVGGPWAVEHLPVPAEVVVYDRGQWQALVASDSRFYRTLRDETVWVVNQNG